MKYSTEFDSLVSAIKITKTANNFAICDTLYKAESGKEVELNYAKCSIEDTNN